MNSDIPVITLNLSDYLEPGLSVFDRDARRVGAVTAYEPDLGYMLVRPLPFLQRIFSIPFRTITHIDAREVFVSHTRAEVYRLYRNPPPRSTLLRERTDSITGADDSEAITTAPSGYDGAPVVVDDVQVSELAREIEPGFRVVSSELEDLGTIVEDPAPRGQMLIRSPFPSREVRMLSTAFIDFVDRQDRLIYLAVSAADLGRLPAVAVEKGG